MRGKDVSGESTRAHHTSDRFINPHNPATLSPHQTAQLVGRNNLVIREECLTWKHIVGGQQRKVIEALEDRRHTNQVIADSRADAAAMAAMIAIVAPPYAVAIINWCPNDAASRSPS